MAIDLHVHSRASDGTEAPEAIVARAAAMGLEAIALTDHDTLAGIARAAEAAEAHGIDFVPGIELSVDWRRRPIHLLAYFLEPGPGPLQNRLAALREGRHRRNREIVAALGELGVPLSHDEVLAQAAGADSVGRPHIAAALVARGVVENVGEAFAAYLAQGRPAYRPRPRLALSEAVEAAWDSGAVPVVAHPHTIGVAAEDYGAAFSDLVAAGVGGLETIYGEYSPEVRAHLTTLATSLGVVATGGSDYHGAHKPDLLLGVGRGDLVVPAQVLEALRAARPR